MSPKADVQEVLVLEPEPLCGAVIAQTARTVFPGARVHRETEPSAAAIVLAERPIGLFIVAMRGFDLDVLTLLGVWAEHDASRTRVLVVTPDANSAALMAIRSLPIAGVYDSRSSDLTELEDAFRAVARGCGYWSRSVRQTIKAIAGTELTPIEVIDDETFIFRRAKAHFRHTRPNRWRNRSNPPRWENL